MSLPEGTTYRCGDHLGVVPLNRPGTVKRVLDRFHLEPASVIVIHSASDSASKPPFPLERPLRIGDLLSRYVELQETATREQIELLAQHTPCPPEQQRLKSYLAAGESGQALFRDEVFSKHVSILDLLENSPSCSIGFDVYLAMLPKMKPRYYSISSSPMVLGRSASVTVGVVKDKARSGSGTYEGVASNYLSERHLGDVIVGYVRSPGTGFHPPEDASVPMIMVGAGTGLAPFRGFLQERKGQKDQGRRVGPALLFFGCRHPEHDFLYEDELRAYEAEGLVRVIPAFSRVEGQPKCYVQNNITANADEAWSLIDQGAIIYVCGDAARLAPGVRDAFLAIAKDKLGEGAVDAWRGEMLAKKRYVEDVWASG